MNVPYALLFGSGFCALVYQVAWLRELRLVFGASTAASAAVLAVFMGGLGLGGALLGRRATQSRRPLMLYGNLELGIAGSAALTPILMMAARAAYVGVGGSVLLGGFGGTVVRLIFAALVLGVPTFLMGGTLPAAAQAVENERDVGRRNLAALYGFNTLGAVAGALTANFALLEILGTRHMLWTACSVNALIALFARSWSRRGAEVTPSAATSGPSSVARLPLIAAFVAGFAFLLMELVWYRMLGPLLGGSSFAFGLILAMALAGIGLGGLAYSLFGGRANAQGFALTCAAEAACLAIPYALGDRIAVWSSLLQTLGGVGFYGQVLVWCFVAFLVVFPAAFVSGVQFPLLLAWVGRGDDHVGQQVGLVYAWNTVGAIVGSLAGGFGLLPLLSAPGAWRIVVVLLVVLAAVAARRAVAAMVIGAGAIACLFAIGPTAAWRHSGVGVGRGIKSGTPNSVRDWVNMNRRTTVWEADGRESSVALTGGSSYAFVVNGKVDGNARADAETQVMGGLLGAILHGHVKKAAVVGLGTGSTAGWLGSIRDIERVDVAELEPAILRVARDCAPVNQNVLDNPRVHIFLGDAREYLLTNRDKYDLIFSEPSNPYRAGVASLFTQEFYRAAWDRLADDGILVQWVQAYSVDAQTIRTIYATLGSVFPYIDTWVTEEPDMMLVAAKRPIEFDVNKLRATIGEEPFKTALDRVWLADDVEGFLARFVARNGLARAIGQAEGEALNTDDQTLVEFGFARMAVSQAKLFNVNDLRHAAQKRREDRPPAEGVEWGRIVLRRLSMLTAQQATLPPAPAEAPEAMKRRARAFARWLAEDRAGALADFASEPTDPLERLMVAECRADAGDAGVEPLIQSLRSTRPVEADAFTARLRLRQNRLPEAALALEAALVAYRTNPWPLPFIMEHTVQLALEMGERDHALAEHFFEVLGQRFSVESIDGKRKQARIQLATLVDFERLCRAELDSDEPWPPWNREFLSLRARCYEGAHDGMSARSRDDLFEFYRNEPLPFATGL